MGGLPEEIDVSMLLLAGLVYVTGIAGQHVASPKCVFEGRVHTLDSWYGFLSNVTFTHSGRLVYRFTYPADNCCLRVLFYTQDQAALLQRPLNCFQKVGILQDDMEKVLRLTPRFTWSGCHMVHRDGISLYECEGGRSFVTPGPASRTTWLTGVSNCASIYGVDITFRMEIYGSVNACSGKYKVTEPLTTPPPLHLPTNSTPMVVKVENPHNPSGYVSYVGCQLHGTLNTNKTWYGFIKNISLREEGRIKYHFTYPLDRRIENVILYKSSNIRAMKPGMSCWDREGVIATESLQDQILELSLRFPGNGCSTKYHPSFGHVMSCSGEKVFEEPTKLYIAVSNCRSKHGLFLDYSLNVYNYDANPCSGTRWYLNSSFYYLFILYVVMLL